MESFSGEHTFSPQTGSLPIPQHHFSLLSDVAQRRPHWLQQALRREPVWPQTGWCLLLEDLAHGGFGPRWCPHFPHAPQKSQRDLPLLKVPAEVSFPSACINQGLGAARMSIWDGHLAGAADTRPHCIPQWSPNKGDSKVIWGCSPQAKVLPKILHRADCLGATRVQHGWWQPDILEAFIPVVIPRAARKLLTACKHVSVSRDTLWGKEVPGPWGSAMDTVRLSFSRILPWFLSQKNRLRSARNEF